MAALRLASAQGRAARVVVALRVAVVLARALLVVARARLDLPGKACALENVSDLRLVVLREIAIVPTAARVLAPRLTEVHL